MIHKSSLTTCFFKTNSNVIQDNVATRITEHLNTISIIKHLLGNNESNFFFSIYLNSMQYMSGKE